MRPYLAIIKDSFSAALASRVLYVLLGIITLLLIVLAPLGIRETSQSFELYYAVWDWDLKDIVQSKQELTAQIVEQISYFFDKFVLSIGLLIAIMVTANIIPETFEPGSLNLLLSKPVSRWALFVSKFIGGCAFVTLCAGYLFLGVWLWMGIQLGVWDRAFLLSIPIYVLAFAIYYSVSALIGLLYRSPIMSIIVTALFWGVCFLVGLSYHRFQARADNLELISIRQFDGQTIAVNSLGEITHWNDSQWQSPSDDKNKTENNSTNEDDPLKQQQEAVEQVAVNIGIYLDKMRKHPLYLPPTFDERSGQVLVGSTPIVDPSAVNYQDCQLAPIKDLSFRNVGKFPRRAMRMFATAKGLVIVNSSGQFYRLSPDQIDQLQTSNNKLKRESFVRIGPNNTARIQIPFQVDMNQSTEEIVSYHEGQLTVFQLDSAGQYLTSRSCELELDFNSSMTCHVNFSGNTILLAFGNGKLVVLDARLITSDQNLFTKNSFWHRTSLPFS